MLEASLLVALLVALTLGSTPLFSAADSPSDHATRRVSTIDGIRGFLALAVVVGHNAIQAALVQVGTTDGLPLLVNWLGQGGVSLFFMITGFLFWGRLIRHDGRMEWLRLYVGRVFRIGPLFLAMQVVLLILVAFATRRLQVPWQTLILQLYRRLCLGVFPPSGINGIDGWLAINLTWTLHYEWLFYFSLPFLGILLRSIGFPFLIAGSCFLLPLVGAAHWREGHLHDECIFIAQFGAGMLTASLMARKWIPGGPDWLRSVVGIVPVLIVGSFVDRVYGVKPVLALSLLFYLVASGTSLFGLLTTRVAHRLGHISYGIYLLHGVLIQFVFTVAAPWIIASPVVDLTMRTLVVGLTVLSALAGHRWVELPGMRLGDRVYARLRRGMGPRSAGAEPS